MTRVQKRLALLILVTAELVGAAVVLRWALVPDGERPPGVALAPDGERSLVGVSMEEGLPSGVAQAVGDWVSHHGDELAWADPAAAKVRIGWQKGAGADLLAEIVLIPADRFPSLREDISLNELRQAWLGQTSASTLSRLFVSDETAAVLVALFGSPGPRSAVTVVPAAELAGHVWAEPGSLAVVPFSESEPSLKALSVDGLQALDRDLNLRRYPLVARIWAGGPADRVDGLVAEIRGKGLDTNRHLDRLTVLAMTGVTALTRHLGLEMEARGDPGWPGRRLADLLSAADVTHVSNEVSFMAGCQLQPEMGAFCSPPEYLETLRLIGTDVVELTGNHNLDFGPDYALSSLDLYAHAGMHTFGGGCDAAEARRPLLLTDHGNRLAFLGYNTFGPDYAWATDDSPGAARFSPEALQADLAQVRSRADLILVSIQYTETYSTMPLSGQVTDFRAAIDAGADVVSGSQAHQPQAMEFYSGKPILYGLGNLFFDQDWSDETGQSLIARYSVYEGRLISLQLIPTVLGGGYQPDIADEDAGQAILQTVFDASGWQ